jgi:hypothetical protein
VCTASTCQPAGHEGARDGWRQKAQCHGFGASAHSNTSSTKTPTPTPMMVAIFERGGRCREGFVRCQRAPGNAQRPPGSRATAFLNVAQMRRPLKTSPRWSQPPFQRTTQFPRRGHHTYRAPVVRVARQLACMRQRYLGRRDRGRASSQIAANHPSVVESKNISKRICFALSAQPGLERTDIQTSQLPLTMYLPGPSQSHLPPPC